MSVDASSHDAVVIGGGFYGAAIAVYLSGQRGMKRVLLVEQEDTLLKRASYNNQARVHNGYHYPRSFTTAYRSRVNLPRFVAEWPEAVRQDFTKLYAIARRNSKVTSKQFERFCREVGATLQRVDTTLKSMFNPNLIEDVYLVDEYAFDASKLAQRAIRELRETGVTVRLGCRATSIIKGSENELLTEVRSRTGDGERIGSRYVFNCTYSGLNHFRGDFPGVRAQLKHEITEMALMEVPPILRTLGITVMDGPFFSMMPFPARGLHTLSHVRYTPHLHWADASDVNPYQRLSCYDRETRVDRMVRDVARYMPAILGAKYVDSLFEVKTVLARNESDDGRPIFFEQHAELSGCYSVLGGKIDNIFDVLEKLDAEEFPPLNTTNLMRS